jgi:ATP-dependent 26S proteasome regulatory subunit
VFRGLVVVRASGTGKTLLARAAAAECGASFLAIHPSTVASKWLGDGVRYVRAVFSLAAKLSPCVLFVDEVDALLGGGLCRALP